MFATLMIDNNIMSSNVATVPLTKTIAAQSRELQNVEKFDRIISTVRVY